MLGLMLGLLLLTVPASRADGGPVPVVTGVSPDYGAVSSFTPVIITGTGFGDAPVIVSFGSVRVPPTVASPGGVITVYSPALLEPGPVDVLVTASGQTSNPTPADVFTYDTTPTVTAVTPSAGPIGGGNPVTITGTGFDMARVVSFGPDLVAVGAGATVVSDTQIVVAAPDVGVAGTVDVTVTSFATSITNPADQYTFAPPPAITGVSPGVGPLGGGTTVTITGSGFSGLTGVMFGSTPAASYTLNSDTSITATSPANAAGTDDVIVTTAGGGSSEATSADLFTYLPVPTVTGLSPSAGPLAGTATITITGTDLDFATAVDFGSTPSPSITSDSNNAITAVIPPAGSASTVDVTVTTLGGTSATSAADQFTYLASSSSKSGLPPVVTSIDPVAGPVTGGTRVTIDGTNLDGVSAVDFGTTRTASFVVRSDTQIVALVPAHAAGRVGLTVTAGSEQSAAASFMYAPAPRVVTVIVRDVGTVRSSLTATVNDGGIPVTGCEVRYGRTGHYGMAASCSTPSSVSSRIAVVTAQLTRLQAATVYHYQLEVSTAAGAVAGRAQQLTTRPLPLLKAPLLGLVVQRASGDTLTIGHLLGIDGIERGLAGEWIALRCLSTCSHESLLLREQLKPPLNRFKATLLHPLPLSSATQVEVQVSKAGNFGRFAVYAFAQASQSLSVRLVRTGCLSTRGQIINCPDG